MYVPRSQGQRWRGRMYTMPIDPGIFVNIKIICRGGAVLCRLSLSGCTSPKELPVHLDCVLICTVMPQWSQAQLGWKLLDLHTTHVCRCMCAHARCVRCKKTPMKEKARSTCSIAGKLAASKRVLRKIPVLEVGDFAQEWGEGLWKPKSALVEL